jgi:hypothetical protein
MRSFPSQLLQQPRPRRLPVPFGRRDGDPEGASGLFEGQTTDKAELGQLTLARIEGGEAREGQRR